MGNRPIPRRKHRSGISENGRWDECGRRGRATRGQIQDCEEHENPMSAVEPWRARPGHVDAVGRIWYAALQESDSANDRHGSDCERRGSRWRPAHAIDAKTRRGRKKAPKRDGIGGGSSNSTQRGPESAEGTGTSGEAPGRSVATGLAAGRWPGRRRGADPRDVSITPADQALKRTPSDNGRRRRTTKTPVRGGSA